MRLSDHVESFHCVTSAGPFSLREIVFTGSDAAGFIMMHTGSGKRLKLESFSLADRTSLKYIAKMSFNTGEVWQETECSFTVVCKIPTHMELFNTPGGPGVRVYAAGLDIQIDSGRVVPIQSPE